MTPIIDNNGRSGLQVFVSRMLVDLLSSYVAALERPVFVCTNQYFFYERQNPGAFVTPDVYTIDGITVCPRDVSVWKTWEPGVRPPTLAIEIVSDDYPKPYAGAMLERYEQLGVRELVRYDPECRVRRPRELFAHFTRDDHGRLVARPASGDRVRLVSFDAWLVRHVWDTLRLGVGPKGLALWPTTQERAAAAAKLADAETERADALARLADAEAARAAAAEAELERLRAELAALKGK